MEEFPDSADLSMKLSHALGAIVNEQNVNTMRRLFMYLESHNNVHTYKYEGRTIHFFGSTIEGSTTFGLNSDIDMLINEEMCTVLQDFTTPLDYSKTNKNLFLLLEDTEPGYCRLHDPLYQVLPDDKVHALDKQKRVLLKNNCIFNYEPNIAVENGPAFSSKTFGKSTDYVVAFKCNTWLKEAYEWFTRQRHNDWPPKKIIKEAANDGFFVVPVGNKLSETKDLEWRISFSLTERHLMFSLNIIQMRVFVVLKMLVKTFIKPRVGDSITSYQCKTALFYCIEENKPEIWRDDNILSCIQACLSYLLRWVRNCYCPHYILPGCNLFAGKVTQDKRDFLMSALQSMKEKTWRHLIQISINDLGQLLQDSSSTKLLYIRHIYNSFYQTLDISAKKVKEYKDENDYMFERGKHFGLGKKASEHIVEGVQNDIQTLCKSIQNSDGYKQEVNRCVHQRLIPFLGSLLASEALSKHNIIPTEALDHLQRSSEPYHQLKFASTLYCNGDFQKLKLVLDSLYPLIYSSLPYCICFPIDYQVLMNQSTCIHNYLHVHGINDNKGKLAACVKCCVLEMHCLPPGMQYELYKLVGEDERDIVLTGLHKISVSWIYLALADCFSFFFYLQYLNRGKLGQRDLQLATLEEFEHYLKIDKSIAHRETGWNLLGQCMEQEHKLKKALNCYRQSLNIRPRVNAANWHLSILLCKLVHGNSKSRNGTQLTQACDVDSTLI